MGWPDTDGRQRRPTHFNLGTNSHSPPNHHPTPPLPDTYTPNTTPAPHVPHTPARRSDADWLAGSAAPSLIPAMLRALRTRETGTRGQSQARRLTDCGTGAVIGVDAQTGQPSTYGAYRCGQALCPACRARRIYRHLNHWYGAAVRAIEHRAEGQISMLTLTIRSKYKLYSVARANLHHAFRALRRQTAWLSEVKTAAAFYDVTWNVDHVHVHLHVLVHTERAVDWSSLSRRWRLVVLSNGYGDATDAHWQTCGTTRVDRMRICNYFAKPPLSLAYAPPSVIRDYCWSVYRAQTISVYGSRPPARQRVAYAGSRRILPIMRLAHAVDTALSDPYAARLLARMRRYGVDRPVVTDTTWTANLNSPGSPAASLRGPPE